MRNTPWELHPWSLPYDTNWLTAEPSTPSAGDAGDPVSTPVVRSSLDAEVMICSSTYCGDWATGARQTDPPPRVAPPAKLHASPKVSDRAGFTREGLWTPARSGRMIHHQKDFRSNRLPASPGQVCTRRVDSVLRGR